VNLTIIVGIYLAYRRVCILLISPLGGYIADKWGSDNTYLAAYWLTILGLLLIAIGQSKTGIIAVFAFNSITAALGPKNAMDNAKNYLKEVAINSTWADVGAALGTLAGGLTLFAFNPTVVIIIATFVLTLACIYHAKQPGFNKAYYKWK
jgi:predicted MFS family arabinose efflux permease